MKCIILAGGFATRLWPLTENKAKPLLHLKDRPIISHIAEGLPEDMDIIISTNAVFEDEFKEWASRYPKRNIKIFVEDSTEDKSKKGALGATALVIDKMGIDEDILLIAGDNYFGFKMADFMGFFKGNPLLAAFDIKDLHSARKFGVVVSRGGKVAEFQEKPSEPKSTLVSTGCYIFPRKNLKDISDYARQKNDDLGGIFEYLLKKGETIDVFSFAEQWFDVGSFDGYLNANRTLLDNKVIEKNNVTKTGANQFKGGVYLGEDVTVTNSTIHDSIVLSGCKIDNCVIRNCVIDENCTLQNLDLSHKMIRQHSNIKK
jgi:glucose-1-phosphate thymidylyltransferase